MDTLTPELLSHQRGPARRPALSLSLQNSRLGAPRLPWSRIDQSGDFDGYPVAAAIGADNVLHRIANVDSEIYVASTPSPTAGADFDTWASLDATNILTGAGVAITVLGSEVLAAYITENAGTYAVLVRSSTDAGLSWSAPTTVVSGATVIDLVALASHNSLNTDTALFFATAGDDEVWHRRRTSGSWAGSSTNWTRQSTVQAISGIAAAHNGDDFILAVTGTAETTEAPTAWALRCGDFDFTPDLYSALSEVITLDPGSSSAFAWPIIFATATRPIVAFCWKETGDTANTRYFLSHPFTFSPTSDTYVQPYPLPSEREFAAFAHHRGSDNVYLVDGEEIWRSGGAGTDTVELDAYLLSAEWSYGPSSTRARFTLDNSSGELNVAGLAPGKDLLVFAGYRSGAAGAEEYGAARRFHVERTEASYLRDGKRTTTILAAGPWEAAARWHTPITQAFALGDRTPEQLFQYIAGRAGIATQGAASGYWDSSTPGFLLPAGETARSAILRLMQPIQGVINVEAGSLLVSDLEEATATDHYCHLRGLGHPILAAALLDQPPETNWLRLQGPDRYADAVDHDSVGAHGPRFDYLRRNDATNDDLSADYAQDALNRILRDRPALRITVPYHAGQTLWDLVSVHFAPLGVDGYFHVIHLQNTYTRRPAPGTYETTLTLTPFPALGPAPSHH